MERKEFNTEQEQLEFIHSTDKITILSGYNGYTKKYYVTYA